MSAKRAAIYARVSSAGQRDAHTIQSQLQALPAYVALQGWMLVGTYVDDGRSATTGKLDARDGFTQLVKATDRGEIDVVVVVDVDRLTRSDDMRERAAILGTFQRAGVTIATPSTGPLDLRSMTGELYVTMQAIFAAEENRKRLARTQAGKLRGIASNRKPAGPTPYGLAYDKATGAWSTHPTTGPVVREIYERIIRGDSCQAIAEDLDARRVPPPRGPWSREMVRHLIQSRHTVGEWTVNRRERLAIQVPALVDETTWQAAQRALVGNRKRALRKTTHVYLLEGLCVCGLCGSPIRIRSANSNGKGTITPAAYACRANLWYHRDLEYRRDHPRCTAEPMLVAELDDRVWAAVAAKLDSPDIAAELQRLAEEQAANRRDWQADIAGYRSHLARLAKVEASQLARFRRGAISDAAMDTELAAIARERGAVQAQLATAETAALASASEPMAQPGAWLESMRALARNASPEARHRIVRAMVTPGAVLDGRTVRLTVEVQTGQAVTDLRLVQGSR